MKTMDRDDDSTRIEQAAAAWLARRDAGAWSAQDERTLQAWLGAGARHRVAWLRLESAWREAGRLQALAAGRPAGVPPRGSLYPARTAAAASADAPRIAPPDLRELRFAPRPRAHRNRWGRLAATVAACVALAGFAWGGWQLSGRQAASYASGVGELREVTLADGSRVVLSSDSRLDVRMSRGERRIGLSRGEAFFRVAHDAGRPFVVAAEGREVRAVGTRFAVRRSPEALRVVVTEGKVRLDGRARSDGSAPPAVLLTAGSVATADHNGLLVRALPLAEAERLLQWREGFLSFEDASLASAVAEFNRYNARKLELGDAAVGQLRVGGNFRWSNAEGFVSLLELGFPVRAERHADRIVLHRR